MTSYASSIQNYFHPVHDERLSVVSVSGVLYGSSKDVVFLQKHNYGVLGISDFTHIKSPVTIAGEPLKHMLFHYRIPASGWAFTQVIYGGESFVAFSDGLQNAFIAAQGVPQKLRTDSLRKR